MMRKGYTAQEMREVSNRLFIEERQTMLITEAADMLSRLADTVEREEREEREKKYEYSLRTSSGHIVGLIPTSEEQARRHMIPGDSLIRREVGGWEEVQNV